MGSAGLPLTWEGVHELWIEHPREDFHRRNLVWESPDERMSEITLPAAKVTTEFPEKDRNEGFLLTLRPAISLLASPLP